MGSGSGWPEAVAAPSRPVRMVLDVMAKMQAAQPVVAPRKKPRITPLDFLAQVRSETEKVTWPSRKETSVFFLAADFIMQKAVGLVLGIGG